jgi:Holliday junction resolvase RusA-like endonuclease
VTRRLIELELELRPQPAARARVDRGRGHNTPRYAEYLETLRWTFLQARSGRIAEGPVSLEIVAAADLLEVRATEREGEPARGKLRGDLDNIAKAIGDAGNGVLWNDDAQIEELHARIRRDL